MVLTQSRFALISSFLWSIITLTFRALMLPFIFFGCIVLLRGLGIFQSPTIEDLRSIAAWLASADSSDILASFKGVGMSYVLIATICLGAMWVISPPQGKDWTRTLDVITLRLTRSAFKAITRYLPASLSPRWKRAIAIFLLGMLPILILQLAHVSKPKTHPPVIAQPSNMPVQQPQAAILMPDGTVVRGIAEIKPGSEPMTYVVTLTAHSK